MIEDKFGAELLGLQLPVSSLGRPPSTPPGCRSSCLPLLYPTLLKFPTLSSPPSGLWGWEAWAVPGPEKVPCTPT